jgi:flagellar basal-body rod protein FlgB
MSLTPDNLFGIHTQALDLWQRRTEVLANNLANADTPGYLARDIDFRKALAAAGGSSDKLPLQTTGSGQVDAAERAAEALAYRVPTQPSMDGNTVDAQVEQANFAENAVRYQATLTFLNSKFRTLITAIMGS